MNRRVRASVGALLLSFALLVGPVSAQGNGLQKINHIVVIYQENWSFDSLYGKFPGANGLDEAAATTPQVDKNGAQYPTLPQPLNTDFSPAIPDPRFPANMPVAPFDLTKFV